MSGNRCILLLVTLLLGLFSGAVFAHEFTIYTNHPRDTFDAFIAEFQKDHPDVKVNVFRAPVEELFTILTLEMQIGQNRADVIYFAEHERAEWAKKQGWLEPMSLPDEILQHYDPAVIDPDGYWVGFSWTGMLIHYNPNLVSPDEVPSSYIDLLDPRWRGKIAIGDPSATGMVHLNIWHVTDYLFEKYGEPYGWGWYEKFKEQEPLLLSGHRQVRSLVATGERPIGIMTTGMSWAGMREGEPGDYVYFDEGTPTVVGVFGIAKGTRNREAADIFLEWAYSERGQAAQQVTIGDIPYHSGVSLETPHQDALEDINPIPVPLTPELRAVQAEKVMQILR